MFKFPDWPHTLVVRHLECISCKHMLEISEGDVTNEGKVKGLVPHYMQHPNQTVRRKKRTENVDKTRTVDCPRCGADNRNWLYLSLRPYAERLPKWGGIGVIVATSLLILAGPLLLLFRQTKTSKMDTQYVILVVAAYLAIILPLLLLSPRWRDLRDHKYLQQVTALSWHRRISPLWRDGLLLIFLLTVMVPVSRYLIFPAAQNQLETLIASKPELEGSARITQLLNAVDNSDPAQLDATALALSVSNIQRILAEQRLCQRVNWRVARARLEHVKQLTTDPVATAVIADVTQNLDGATAGGTCRPAYLQIAKGILQEYQEQLENSRVSRQCAALADTAQRSLCQLNEQLSASLPTAEAAAPPQTENAPSYEWQSLAQDTEIATITRQTLGDLRQFWAASNDFPAKAQIDAELDNIERLLESRALQSQLAQNLDFVASWIKLVGFSGIAATIIAVVLAGQEERLYDPNLPRPVFHSVAAMAPAVIWELNETVGLPVNADRIQWMNIERNGQGGVTLTGLYRSAYNGNGNASDQVRGQEFVVQTDPWCYIQNTAIRDVMVAPPLKDDKPPVSADNESASSPAFAVNNGRIQST